MPSIYEHTRASTSINHASRSVTPDTSLLCVIRIFYENTCIFFLFMLRLLYGRCKDVYAELGLVDCEGGIYHFIAGV